MNISKSLVLLSKCNQFQKCLIRKKVIQPVFTQNFRNNMSVSYRKIPEGSKNYNKYGIFINSVMWWWILWHLFTDYEELYEPILPDPKSFTDEELGVPPL